MTTIRKMMPAAVLTASMIANILLGMYAGGCRLQADRRARDLGQVEAAHADDQNVIDREIELAVALSAKVAAQAALLADARAAAADTLRSGALRADDARETYQRVLAVSLGDPWTNTAAWRGRVHGH